MQLYKDKNHKKPFQILIFDVENDDANDSVTSMKKRHDNEKGLPETGSGQDIEKNLDRKGDKNHGKISLPD